ncbi:MAG: HAMP domain-containing sensor histidine kinase [Candidatus Aminicenantes bacterium]|nr:HAMP domain-containing sensor histidine kinase [Candidatus Aminicenantes bacterium]
MSHASPRRPARPGSFRGPGRRLIAVFALFVLLPGALLGVFALRVLRQESQLARQRTRESLERTAAEISRDLEAEFQEWSDTVRSAASREKPLAVGFFPEFIGQAFSEPGGGVFLSLADEKIEVFPPGALLFVPRSPATSPTALSRPPVGLAEAESLEIAQKDYPSAIRAYRGLLDSAAAGSRPLILQRLARTLRKAGRLEEAAGAYRDLRRLAAVWIGGLPSDLIAQAELCALASERGDTADLARTAMAFYRDLASGKWLLDKPRYLYYSELGRTWCRDSRVEVGEFDRLQAAEGRRLALSRAAEDFLNDPRTVFPGERNRYLAFLNKDPFAAVLVSADVLASRWWPRILAIRAKDLEAVVFAADGSAVFGSSPPVPPPFAVTRDLRIDGARWLLQIWPGRPEGIYADIRQKRTLSLAMLGFVTIMLAFGSYLTVRIVKRELEIARLRADFVSTVSHEFRSPLTGIRQLGSMLLDGRVPDSEKQRGYFKMIVQESDRLSRLVENILDFSRMEEGRKEYRFAPLDPTPWLRTVVADFVTEFAANGAAVEADIPDGLPLISADREALGSAVRNLLDNAVKYSPGSKTVWLDAGAEGDAVKISVRDKGVGISEHDQKHIFDRFYRAEAEISKRVKGVGLGLSLVKHVVTAHGGTVECRSRAGEGSDFIIRLPAAPVRGGG